MDQPPRNELRQDRTTGRWVIIAPRRGGRPHDNPSSAIRASAPPRYDPTCPFCPGNEAQLLGIIDERGAGGSGWQVRVVPNKYPTVHPDAPALPHRDGRVARPATGVHEVLIEGQRHDGDLVTLSDAEVALVLCVARDRCRVLIEQPEIESVIVFRNHGATSGASLIHPHSQVMALNMVPPLVQATADWVRREYDAHGQCPTCTELALERSEGERVLEETANVMAWVPFAASVPSEIWLAPKEHAASFVHATDGILRETATVLRRILQRLAAAHGDPSYSFVVDSAAKADLSAPHLHWRIRIAPDLVTWGGFELGAAMPVNPSSPEQDAAVLRAVKLP